MCEKSKRNRCGGGFPSSGVLNHVHTGWKFHKCDDGRVWCELALLIEL